MTRESAHCISIREISKDIELHLMLIVVKLEQCFKRDIEQHQYKTNSGGF